MERGSVIWGEGLAPTLVRCLRPVGARVEALATGLPPIAIGVPPAGTPATAAGTLYAAVAIDDGSAPAPMLASARAMVVTPARPGWIARLPVGVPLLDGDLPLPAPDDEIPEPGPFGARVLSIAGVTRLPDEAERPEIVGDEGSADLARGLCGIADGRGAIVLERSPARPALVRLGAIPVTTSLEALQVLEELADNPALRFHLARVRTAPPTVDEVAASWVEAMILAAA